MLIFCIRRTCNGSPVISYTVSELKLNPYNLELSNKYSVLSLDAYVLSNEFDGKLVRAVTVSVAFEARLILKPR